MVPQGRRPCSDSRPMLVAFFGSTVSSPDACIEVPFYKLLLLLLDCIGVQT
jgi:hypothetical protein